MRYMVVVTMMMFLCYITDEYDILTTRNDAVNGGNPTDNKGEIPLYQTDETQSEEFNFKKYWGPDDYRPHVEFDRNSIMQCVYCGDVADSREHCPSKVFLTKPFPPDLPVVPACKKCNNSYAQDELYLKAFLQFFEEYQYDNITATVDMNRKEVRDAKERMESIIRLQLIDRDPRIDRILTKLAICHSVYELTEGYYSDTWHGVLESVSYRICFPVWFTVPIVAEPWFSIRHSPWTL